MIGELFKRTVNVVVVVLATLAFFLVPIGKKTTAQHAVAIFSTPPAREAAASFAEVARQLVARVRAELAERGAVPGDPSTERRPTAR